MPAVKRIREGFQFRDQPTLPDENIATRMGVGDLRRSQISSFPRSAKAVSGSCGIGIAPGQIPPPCLVTFGLHAWQLMLQSSRVRLKAISNKRPLLLSKNAAVRHQSECVWLVSASGKRLRCSNLVAK